MRKSLIGLAGIVVLILMTQNSEAKNYIYPMPPPNDTSLLYAAPKKQHLIRASKVKPKHRHVVSASKGNFYVYYALPASACCGETWTLHQTRCCAHSGEWQTSHYATFKLAPDDFIYSATNNDEERSYDTYRDVVANEIIEDPNYY